VLEIGEQHEDLTLKLKEELEEVFSFTSQHSLVAFLLIVVLCVAS